MDLFKLFNSKKQLSKEQVNTTLQDIDKLQKELETIEQSLQEDYAFALAPDSQKEHEELWEQKMKNYDEWTSKLLNILDTRLAFLSGAEQMECQRIIDQINLTNNDTIKNIIDDLRFRYKELAKLLNNHNIQNYEGTDKLLKLYNKLPEPMTKEKLANCLRKQENYTNKELIQLANYREEMSKASKQLLEQYEEQLESTANTQKI